MATNYEKLSPEGFSENLRAMKYATLTGARRAIGKVDWPEKAKDKARALADGHFAGSAGVAAPKMAKKAATAKVVKKAVKAAPVPAAKVKKVQKARRAPAPRAHIGESVSQHFHHTPHRAELDNHLILANQTIQTAVSVLNVNQAALASEEGKQAMRHALGLVSSATVYLAHHFSGPVRARESTAAIVAATSVAEEAPAPAPPPANGSGPVTSQKTDEIFSKTAAALTGGKPLS